MDCKIFAWKNVKHFDRYTHNTGNKSGEVVRVDVWMKDSLEKRIVGKGKEFLSLTEI